MSRGSPMRSESGGRRACSCAGRSSIRRAPSSEERSASCWEWHRSGCRYWGGVLYLILAVALFQGAAIRQALRAARASRHGIPGSERDVANVALVFGVLNGVSLLLSIAATEVLKRTVDLETQRVLTRALSVLNTILIAAVVGFALTDGFVLAVILLWTAGVVREVQAPSRGRGSTTISTLARVPRSTRSEGRRTPSDRSPAVQRSAPGRSVDRSGRRSSPRDCSSRPPRRSTLEPSGVTPATPIVGQRPTAPRRRLDSRTRVRYRGAPRGPARERRCGMRMAFRARSTRECRCTT